MMKSVIMSCHTKHLKELYHRNIGQGSKTIEGRLNRPEYKYTKGHIITWICGNAPNHHTTIEDIRTYSTFRQMLEQEGIRNVLPGVETMEEALKVYLKSDTNPDGLYTMEDEQELGVMAIQLKCIRWSPSI